MSAGYGIPFLKDRRPYLYSYNYVVYTVYRLPTYPQGMSSLGLLSGTSMYSTDVYPNPNIPNRHGPWPNISNRRWSQENSLFLPPQLSASAPQPIPTNMIPNQISATYVGDPSISIRSRATLPSDAKAPPEFSNRLRDPPNCLQPILRLPKILSTDTRAFKPDAVASPGLSQIWTPSLSQTLLLGTLAILTLKRFLVYLFMIAWLAHILNVKITVTGWFYPFHARIPINL